MAENMNENVIEFLRNEPVATVTFSQGKYITKIRKLAKRFPDECQITHENQDGSIVAHIPVKWIKINNTQREMTEEEKKLAAERIRNTLWRHKKDT